MVCPELVLGGGLVKPPHARAGDGLVKLPGPRAVLEAWSAGDKEIPRCPTQ